MQQRDDALKKRRKQPEYTTNVIGNQEDESPKGKPKRKRKQKEVQFKLGAIDEKIH